MHTPPSDVRADHADRVDRADRADDVLALARLATRRGAVREMLGWLARRTGGPAMLVGGAGRVLAGPGGEHDPAVARLAADAAADAAAELHRRGAASAVLGGGEGPPVHLIALDTDPRTYLAVVGPDDPRCGTLLADAARTLALCWRLEQSERARRRIESAEEHSREAVLHLLMVGSVPAAQRIAGALRPPLPAVVRIYVIECPPARRREIVRRIDREAGGGAWIVPCPVRPNHILALVPPEPGPAPAAAVSGAPRGGPAPLDLLIVRLVPECRVGVSAAVPLRDTPTAYEQAIHALAVARNAPEHRAGFGGDVDVTVLAGPEGYVWASELLAPCLRYAPARRADPGPQELLGTLGSWLSFGGAASRHLKIHRNTLAARMRHLDELLGVEVSRSLPAQSALWLALRLHTAPQAAAARAQAPPGHIATLDAVLATPAAGTWARAQLRPLEQAGPTAGLETIRTWLRADARLPAAAAALGISLPGARKRLTRAEDVLGRSLLTAPSAKYELWLAMRALGSL
ncbi:PucR family transcriptional regulator [Streptomyces rugosispiralis]|uniref:Helix-turn-helix domain-containing protein n=1 Tax=Streptomyces rugosispiralis TaxID=2967341 RepID=A0ABT1V3H5_9ACTN|nr:helix-turn-helix domain-containing protein [Streptomyces rugosispiralis]MCQ8191937.1 helix-turn-helix domain-containing protein [Streptomyces rugosispiralis]